MQINTENILVKLKKNLPLKVRSNYEDDPNKMANIQSQQYKLVLTTPKDIPDVTLKLPQNRSSLSEITITEKDIKVPGPN